MDEQKKIAYEYLDHAQKALRAGNKILAQEYCDLAENTASDLEEVWLLKATLSEPAESVVCLQKALEINPNSERARKGMLWAQERLSALGIPAESIEQAANEPVQEISPEVAETVESLDKNPFKVGTPEDIQVSSENASQTQEMAAVAAANEEKPVAIKPAISWTRKWLAPLSILILLVLLALAAFYQSNLIQAFEPMVSKGIMAGSGETIDLVIPTKTHEVGAQLSPTTVTTEVHQQAEEPTNTEIPSPIPTQTVLPTTQPTNTVLPSRTPLPTATEAIFLSPTTQNDVLPSPTTQEELQPSPTTQIQALMTVTPNPAWIGVPSPTPLPTDTDEPQFSVDPVPTSAVIAPITSPGSGARWIDVDLTNQMLYAYEGDQMLNAFVVSTGTWQYPTVTGSYNVYVKYLYKDMSGVDYYLPDVPYTMFFYDGYAIHGTYWHSNFGVPMSHGCVNMTIPDAAWIYQFSSVGTTVNVHY